MNEICSDYELFVWTYIIHTYYEKAGVQFMYLVEKIIRVKDLALTWPG